MIIFYKAIHGKSGLPFTSLLNTAKILIDTDKLWVGFRPNTNSLNGMPGVVVSGSFITIKGSSYTATAGKGFDSTFYVPYNVELSELKSEAYAVFKFSVVRSVLNDVSNPMSITMR
jgi:hypothetical protein